MLGEYIRVLFSSFMYFYVSIEQVHINALNDMFCIRLSDNQQPQAF
jgi:hypothetical protein